MSAGILLTKDKIHEALQARGYTPTESHYKGHTQHYLYWKAPWGHIFSVPNEDHKCPTWILEEIISDVEKTRPAEQQASRG